MNVDYFQGKYPTILRKKANSLHLFQNVLHMAYKERGRSKINV